MDVSSEFCGACGAVLLLCAGGAPACDVCGAALPSEDSGGGLRLVARRKVAPSETLRQLTEAATDVGGAQEAVISETCPQCKNDKMSFHTAQLRSADEGQTIFYTCLRCKYKFTHNS
ncbi:hypothetical protein MMPV_008547 [Pyropia vietnamensis]